MPTVTLQYHVQAGVDITLDAIIGDGQAGGHAAFLGTVPVAQAPQQIHANLGDGADLVGRVLVVSSVAVDIQPVSDHVSVVVQLEGGHPSPLPIVQGADATPGGSVSFLTVVTFVGGEGT